MLTVGPLEGIARDSGAPTINAKNINGSPLGGSGRDLGAPTINTKNVDGEPHGMRC
jgi:hypothetical protein